MLEKIGLPAKPSLRGNNWVIDASHCQGCSSQFTFINRKHHCRRCGGIFCGSCTYQRMILRGQGDAPVRICDPCKKLEEAARFEMRYGHKTRAGRGGSKLTRKDEDEVLNQILGSDRKEPNLSGRESTTNEISNHQRASSSASFSSQDWEGDTPGTPSFDTRDHASTETGSDSPEQLRQQALDEKKKYKTLKAEGKPEEALRAFKRGKELERQAGALEVALRKNRRKAFSSSNLSDIKKIKDDPIESDKKMKLSPQMGKEKEGKDDFVSELRELGWSEADRKPATMSLEGELSSLLGEVSQKSNIGKRTSGIDKAQVLAHKKKALLFKREGKLGEAKEELKKAKILEKQLEEQEFLAEADDSDDELSSLIRSMDDDKHDDLSIGYAGHSDLDFGQLVSVPEDLDGNFEVTDADMDDPEISAALKSLGWTEESDLKEDIMPEKEALLDEVLSLKREAVNQKHMGNAVEAMALLKKAKILERDISVPKVSVSQNAEESLESDKLDDETFGSVKDENHKQPPKSKLMLQKELLALKKKALVLRREGRLDEAEQELKKGKVLENQLKEMEDASKAGFMKGNIHSNEAEPVYEHPDITETLGISDGAVINVTDQDMHDPTLLSVLKNLGWNEDIAPSENSSVVPKSKAEIQRELLGLKRKALALRRQGQAEEVEEVLRMAKVLEAQMEEMEVPKKEPVGDFTQDGDSDSLRSLNTIDKKGKRESTSKENETRKSASGISLMQGDGDIEPSKVNINPSERPIIQSIESSSDIPIRASRSKAEIQRELLGLKRKALALRRQGKTEEAEEILKMAKDLETRIEEMDVSTRVESFDSNEETDSLKSFNAREKPENVKTVSDPETFLPIEGKASVMAELAPPLSEDATFFPQSGQSVNIMDILTGDDWRSPQLPIDEVEKKQNFNSDIYSLGEPSLQPETSGNPNKEMGSRDKIVSEKGEEANSLDNSHGSPQKEILARKRKAVALKREGKMAEAREELRQAKLLEKSLKEDILETNTSSLSASTSTSNDTSIAQEIKTTIQAPPKQMSSRDRFKLQQESLSHKRQALKLRREGRMEEADAESKLAKALETQLEEMDGHDMNKSVNEGEAMEDIGVEDFLDPQLLSALKAIGLQDIESVSRAPERSDTAKPKPDFGKKESFSQERSQLEEQIKVEKVKALNLKRAGKQSEAMEALRRAKQLEKKLNSLAL